MKLYQFIKSAINVLAAKRTIGVRALVVNDQHILLVKHTYTPGWYTVGGGVDPGETVEQAMRRELKEEVGVSLQEKPQLFGVYYNGADKADDYIVFFVCREFHEENYTCPHEIAEKKWFPLSQLPDDVTPATKRRIEEYLGQCAVSDVW